MNITQLFPTSQMLKKKEGIKSETECDTSSSPLHLKKSTDIK